MNRRFERCRTTDDWIITVIQRLYPHKGLRSARTCIVTRPFAKGSFRERFTWDDFTFDGDLRIGWKVKSGERSLDDFDGPTENPASPVIFVDSEGNGLRRSDKQERMLTEHHRHGEGFPCAHGLLVMNFTVFPRRDVKTDLVFVLEHHPVASDILDACFRIAGNDQMSCSQITPAVTRMPSGHGKLEQINGITLFDILHHRPRGDDGRFDRLQGP